MALPYGAGEGAALRRPSGRPAPGRCGRGWAARGEQPLLDETGDDVPDRDVELMVKRGGIGRCAAAQIAVWRLVAAAFPGEAAPAQVAGAGRLDGFQDV